MFGRLISLYCPYPTVQYISDYLFTFDNIIFLQNNRFSLDINTSRDCKWRSDLQTVSRYMGYMLHDQRLRIE